MATLPEWCPPLNTLKEDPLTGESVYCICKKPDHGELMVGCDGCDDWFHFTCMHIDEKYRQLVLSFYCPYCQAGITGPMSKVAPWSPETVKVPCSIWKRKCRLTECYMPCAKDSKYCSRDHGRQYFSEMINRFEGNKETKHDKQDNIIKSILSQTNTAQQFRDFGNPEFIIKDIVPTEEEKLIYENVVVRDKKWSELKVEYDKVIEDDIPRLKVKIRKLEEYIQWITQINSQLNDITVTAGESENTTESLGRVISNKKNKKSKRGKGIPKKNICGFSSTFENIPNSTDEFKREYLAKPEEITEINHVCVKLRCNRHYDWANMHRDLLTRQLRSFEAQLENLRIFLEIRKKQLHILFYEQAAKLNS